MQKMTKANKYANLIETEAKFVVLITSTLAAVLGYVSLSRTGKKA